MCGGGGDIFQQAGDALASVDPGPAIGGGLADLDKAVGNTIPGGWATVGAAALMAAGIYDPTLLGMADSGTLTEEALSSAGYDPATVAQQIDPYAGLSANAPVDATLSQEAAASMGSGTGTGGSTASGLGSLTDPSLTAQIGAPTTSGGTFGSITAPLEGSGAIPGAGATTLPGGGLTGALPANVMVGDGTLGTTIGATYMSAGPGQFAVDALGNAIPASSIGIDGFAPGSGLSLSDLQNAKKAADLAKSLTSSNPAKSLVSSLTGAGAGAGAGATMGTAATTPTASTTKTYESPKATFVHGQQISVPGMTGTELAPTPMQQMPNVTPLDLQLIQQAKDGGMIHMAGGGDLPMQEARMRGKQFATYRPHTGMGLVPNFAPGGEVEGHNPTFFSPGGLASMENTYVKGEGDGTSDSVEAMLADGEFVIPADVVSKLGNGSSDAGAKVLDNFLLTIREHAQKHDPKNLPPDSKGALAYLLDAKKKVRA